MQAISRPNYLNGTHTNTYVEDYGQSIQNPYFLLFPLYNCTQLRGIIWGAKFKISNRKFNWQFYLSQISHSLCGFSRLQNCHRNLLVGVKMAKSCSQYNETVKLDTAVANWMHRTECSVIGWCSSVVRCSQQMLLRIGRIRYSHTCNSAAQILNGLCKSRAGIDNRGRSIERSQLSHGPVHCSGLENYVD